VGLSSLTAAGALFLLSQTVVGRNAVATLVEDALSDVVNGEVRVGPIIGGNLLTRAHLAHFEFAETDGTPFVKLDSVRIEYNPLSFLTGTYRFHRVTAQHVDLLLRQHDDGSWNFKRLFGKEEPEPAEERRPGTTRVLLTDVDVRSGRVRVNTPWARGLAGAERDSVVAAGLRGDRLWRVRQVGPDRFQRQVTLDSLHGSFPLIRLVDPVRPLHLQLSGVAAHAAVVTQTLDILRFDGTATFRDTIDIDIDVLQTSGSTLTGDGWVVPTDPVEFAFDLDADPIGFTDLQWLPIPVPTGGGGQTALDIWTRGETIVVRTVGGDVRVDDSRVRGGFVIALEEMPRFESLDITLLPLRLSLVDELLDRERLIDGYIRGPVRGEGPIDLVQIDAELELADLAGSASPSLVGVLGGVSIGPPYAMGELQFGFQEFEPGWTAVIGVENSLTGRTEGTATFTGFIGDRFDFTADLAHALPDGSASHVTGSGTVDLAEPSFLNVQFTADPLALPILEPYAPEVNLVGDVRGPITAQGALSDLRVIADLRTPRGLLNFDGRFDLEAEEKTYDAHLRAHDIQLRQWIENGPATRLAVQGRVRGRGTDPETLEATFDLTLLRSLVEGATVDTSLLRFTVADGLATADTFAIRADAGLVDGRGAFGLAEGRSGSLILDIEVSDLSSWNRWLIPGRNPARQDTSIEALFAAFPDPGETRETEGPPAEEPDTLAGSLSGLGVLYGNVADFSFGGRLLARNVSYGGARADSIQLTVDVADPRILDSLVARASVWRVAGLGGRADSLFVRWQRLGPERSDLELYARRDTSAEVGVHADVRWTSEERAAFIDRFRAKLGEGELRLTTPAYVAYGDSGFVAQGLSLTGDSGEELTLEGIVPDAGAANLDFRLRNIRVESILSLLENRPDIEGTLDADLRLRGTADSPRWDARLQVLDPAVRGLRYERLNGDYRYADRRIEVGMVLEGGGEELGRVDGSILADLTLRGVPRRLLNDPVDLTVVADSIPLEPLELAFQSLKEVTGFARGRVRVTGEPGDLSLDGRSSVLAGGATVPKLGVRIGDIVAGFSFEGSEARVDSARFVSSAGGRGSITGSIGIAEPANMAFDLGLEAHELGGMSRRLARFDIDGEGHLGGTYQAPELTGRFRISEGEIRTERFMRQRQAVDLTDPEVYSLIDTTLVAEQRLFERAQKPFMRNLRMDARIRFGPDFWLRSTALNVELSGELNVSMDRAEQNLVAFGTLRLPRGKYRYISGTGADISSLYSRQLQITAGSITFVGTPGMDPNLDIAAEYETRSGLGPVVITVNIAGTSLSPTMTTTSDPPLPEADEICYLLFSSACLGAGSEGGDFAASLVREGLLGTVSSQVSQVLVSGVGLVDYFDIRSTGDVGPALDSGTTTSLLYGTEIEIGRYLTPDLFVKATQALGGQLPGLSAEWIFMPRWRLEVKTEDRFKRYASYGYSFSTYSDRTWGLMLFREWNF
jgi:hypothetical protein